MDEKELKILMDDYNDPYKRLQRENEDLRFKYQQLKTDLSILIIMVIGTAGWWFITKYESTAGLIIIVAFAGFIVYLAMKSIRSSIQRHKNRKAQDLGKQQ